MKIERVSAEEIRYGMVLAEARITLTLTDDEAEKLCHLLSYFASHLIDDGRDCGFAGKLYFELNDHIHS